MAGPAYQSSNQANDGSDFNFRMVIEDRYKDMAKSRKTLKRSTLISVYYIIARSLWKFSPNLIQGGSLPVTDILILIAGVGAFFLYRFAFGYGRTQHEKLWAIMTSTMVYIVLLAECFLTFFLYHITYGSLQNSVNTKPNAADYPPIPRRILDSVGLKVGSRDYDVGLVALGVIEKGLDLVGIGALAVTAFLMRQYAIDSRDLKREQERRKNAGTKGE